MSITSTYGIAGCGTQTLALAFGGSPPLTGDTEEYNGTSWTTTSSLGTARYLLGGAGSQAAGLAFGGFPANKNATEEFTGAALVVKKITTS